MLAILGSLGQDGDSKVLPNIRKLASGPGVAASDIRVREAAQRTLLILRERIELQHAPEFLLRAASAPEQGTEAPLRLVRCWPYWTCSHCAEFLMA